MPETAIILAGGFGTRLKSVIADLPKPMAPINGQPFLNYQLQFLKHYGIKKIIFSLGHLPEVIIKHFKNEYLGLSITHVCEHEPLGTGGGIRLAMEQCTDEVALVLNGDSFFDMNINEFYKQHLNKSSKVSLALRQVDDAARYGTILTNRENKIFSFKEKSNLSQPGKINAGIYLLEKENFLKMTPPQQNFSIEKSFFEKCLDKIEINGFEFNGYFIDIGLPSDYEKAQHDFKEFKYRY